ncbi:MAG: hypothetical protein ACKOGA_24505 [Planctomycetaceae bacterium]
MPPALNSSSTARLAPGLLVWERAPKWEGVLKARLAGPHCLVRPCRSVTDVLALAPRMPGSVLLVDFDPHPAGALQLLGELQARRLSLHPIAVARAEWRDLEWPAREAGVVAWCPATEPPESVVALCARWLPPPSQIAAPSQ